MCATCITVKKNFMVPFYGWSSTATSRRQFTFYHSVPRNSWYSFYWPWKDEMLSQPWSHLVILNMRPLDWESSTLTTRPLLLKVRGHVHKYEASLRTLKNWEKYWFCYKVIIFNVTVLKISENMYIIYI